MNPYLIIGCIIGFLFGWFGNLLFDFSIKEWMYIGSLVTFSIIYGIFVGRNTINDNTNN
jgi:hypothetical protein